MTSKVKGFTNYRLGVSNWQLSKSPSLSGGRKKKYPLDGEGEGEGKIYLIPAHAHEHEDKVEELGHSLQRSRNVGQGRSRKNGAGALVFLSCD